MIKATLKKSAALVATKLNTRNVNTDNILVLCEDIKKEKKLISELAKKGIFSYIKAAGIDTFPDGDFSPALQHIIAEASERYPFGLYPNSADGNAWLADHPIPTGSDIKPYQEFLWDLYELEKVTRHNLKADTMGALRHTEEALKAVESIAYTGHLPVADTIFDGPLSSINEKTLRQTAKDYLEYRAVWMSEYELHSPIEQIAEITLISFFEKKTGGHKSEPDVIEHDLDDTRDVR